MKECVRHEAISKLLGLQNPSYYTRIFIVSSRLRNRKALSDRWPITSFVEANSAANPALADPIITLQFAQPTAL